MTKDIIPNITSHEAKMFCKLLECGTTSETAVTMDWSTSQVSANLNKLEEKIGKTLFIRNRRLGKFIATHDALQIKSHMHNILTSTELMLAETYKEENYVTITSSHSILEYYLGPFLKSFITKNPNLFINLNLQDELSITQDNVNEIILTCLIEDKSKYLYIPYHSFQQKLWASPGYIDQYGNPKSIEELQAHKLLMRKNTDDPRMLFGSTFLKAQLLNLSELKIYEVRGARIIDYMCESGCGIMAGAEETCLAGNLNVERVFDSFTGDDIELYVCINKEFLNNPYASKVINWIFECRNALFRNIGFKPNYPYTPMK